MGRTSIEWTAGDDGTMGRTWNPVRGCSRVSDGCRHCYAEAIAARFSTHSHQDGDTPGGVFAGFAEMTPSGPRWTGRVELVASKLAEPLSWRKPARVFVNSMSDLFHESLPDEAIDQVFAVMAKATRHTFQVLTKRADRMRRWFLERTPDRTEPDRFGPWSAHDRVWSAMNPGDDQTWGAPTWPLPNVWLGVSVEDQAAADARIPQLLSTPAAVRFISAEPLLGPIDLKRIATGLDNPTHGSALDDNGGETAMLDWVIVGGESGPGARPCDVESVSAIARQCWLSNVPVFVKQLGAKPWHPEAALGWPPYAAGADGFLHLRDRKGSDPSEWRADLRVRGFPEVTHAS